MTKPEEENDEAIEKEVSVILDEVDAIINDPTETIERRKEAQTMIHRAIEKGSNTISGGKGKIWEDLRKRYQYITRMYYNEEIQVLEVIKETLKRQIEQEKGSSYTSSKRLAELKKDLIECERAIDSQKKLLEKLQQE